MSTVHHTTSQRPSDITGMRRDNIISKQTREQKSMWDHIADITTSSWMEKQSLTLGHTRTGQTGSMDKGTGKVLEQGKRNETSISQPSISSGSIDPLAQPLGGHCVCRRKRTGTSRDVCQNRLESGDIHDLSTLRPKKMLDKSEKRSTRTRTRTFGS